VADEQIVTSIVAKADLSSLVSEVHRASASLQQLQRELLASNKAISSSTKLANNLFRDTLTGSGQFSSHFVNLNSDVDKFGKNLDAGRLKLKNYFSTFREHATTQKGMIRELAKEQVMLQNSVLQPLGRNAQGLMQYNVMIPRGLDAVKNSAQLARMELQIMNRALSEGAGSLINWGKNTQWAGRQLTVGLTVPLTMFGAAAGKAFREADQELVRLTKVYGGLAATSASDLKAIREEVVQTAKTLSQTMGASFKDTIALGADIAATGKMGNDLLGSIEETTRLSILGEVDRQDAMKATLSIQTAFKQNTEQLTESINFLNAVENQTSTTLNDLVEAIPKAGPVIQQLGGSIEDLALYMTAMREGGINASEGANALKSGLASLINPTKQTVGMMSDFGIDVMGMVAKNTGNTTGLLIDLQGALDKLDPLSKARALEQMFGKFQFARMSALLNNLGKEGSQTLQVMDLMKASTSDLAGIAERELGMITESASGKYRKAMETLKASLAEVGDEFLGIATKIINAASKVLDFFTNLPSPIKKALTFMAGFTALVGPLIMLTGVLANFFGYITKGIVQLRSFFMKANGWKMLTPEIIAAQKAAEMVENAFYSDAAAAQVLHNALQKLVLDYQNLQAASMKNAVPVNPGVSTVAGNAVVAAGRRVVDPNDPYVGDPNTRAMSHIRPRDPNSPATIFGGVPGAIPVNRGISRTPQMYMHDRLPNIEGLTSVKNISTGIVPGEAAKFHALMATLGMQTEQEVATLKKTIAMGGTVSRELLDTFDDILPITQRFADSAATQSALIVQQMRNAEITVDQAKARILALNAQIEAEMGSAVGTYAASRGRVLDLTKAPMMNQPVVDANGQFTLRDLYKKESNRAVMEEFGRVRGVRTFGAPYSIQTTRPPRFNDGGGIESFGPGKTMVSGPSSINYDDRLGSVPVGGYVLNQSASMDPANAPLVEMASATYENGGEITAALTPKEVVFGPKIQRMPELYAAVDAANSGYSFGGQIMKGTYGYGRDSVLSIWAKLVNSKDYPTVIKAATVASDAAILSQLTGMDIKDATKRVSSDYDEATEYAKKSANKNGTRKTDEFVKARTAQLIRLSKEYPGANLILDAYSSKNKYNQSEKAARMKAIPTDTYAGTMRSVVSDLIKEGVLTPAQAKKVFGILGDATDFYDPISKSHTITAQRTASVFKPGELQDLLIEGGMSKAEAAKFADVTGVRSNNFVGQSTGLAKSFNSMGNWLQQRTDGTFIDEVSPFQDEAKSNFIAGIKKLKDKLGIKGPTTMKEIIRQLTMQRMKSASGFNSKMLTTVAGRLRHISFAKPALGPLAGSFNKGGMIPGGSISRNRLNYGNPAQLIKLLAADKQLKILAKARELSSRASLGKFADTPVTEYGHQILPSSGMSYPIPGVSGLYKVGKKKVFVKGVDHEVVATHEPIGTDIARRLFKIEAPVQKAVTVNNPLDPRKKSKLLALESDYDPRFANTNVPWDEDTVIRQLANSLLLNNKDLSRGNVYGNFNPDVGQAGVFPKASGNTALADEMNSMEKQAMINLLAVKGGARKDFARDTSEIVRKMTPKKYGRLMKKTLETARPELVKIINELPADLRPPYIKMLERLDEGIAVDWSKYHAVHANPKYLNAGGPIGGSIKRGRYAYGKKGNPAARAAQIKAKKERAASYTPSGGSSYTATGNPQMQVSRVPYVGGTGVRGNAYTGEFTPSAARTISTMRLAQFPRMSMPTMPMNIPGIGNTAAISAAFASMGNSIKKDSIQLAKAINFNTKYIASSLKDTVTIMGNNVKTFATNMNNSARAAVTSTLNFAKRARNAIIREQNAYAAARYPAGQAPAQGLFGPGLVGAYKNTGVDGVQSRKVGSLGMRRTEYLVNNETTGGQDVVMSRKQAKAAGVPIAGRGPMGMGAQMGIGMAGSMAGMALMSKEKVSFAGKEMSGMSAGMGVMAASSILPFLPFAKMGGGLKSAATGAAGLAKGFSAAMKAGTVLVKIVPAILRLAKGFGPIGLVVSALGIGLKMYQDYKDAQQDASMGLSMTAKAAEQAGVKYFNLKETMQGYIDKAKLAAAAAKGSAGNTIGMPGLPRSIEELKKAKEEGKGLKDLIESINRSSSTEETQRLINNQKAQMVAAGMSIEEANKKIYGALANSEKSQQVYQLLADKGFSAITDKASAAEFAVGNLVNTLDKGAGTADFGKEVGNGFEGLINVFQNATASLVGTKDALGNVIDDYKAYEMVMSKAEQSNPGMNKEIGVEAYENLAKTQPLLASITNEADSIKGILAKWKLFTSGINVDLSKIDSTLAIKLAGFNSAVDSGITALTKAADDKTTFGTMGKAYSALQKTIAATSAAAQRANAASQRSAQEELKIIAKKIKLIEDEKNKKLESLRATQDASNYALELQKLQIEYADAVARGDMATAARARIDIDQLTMNRQSDLAVKAIEDAAAKAKAPLEKDAEGIQNRQDKKQVTFQNNQDNSAVATEIADKLQKFQTTFNDLATRGTMNELEPDADKKAKEEAKIQAEFIAFVKEVQAAYVKGGSTLKKTLETAFPDYFSKGKPIPVETVTSSYQGGGRPVTTTTVNQGILNSFKDDIKALTAHAELITGGTTIKQLSADIKKALGYKDKPGAANTTSALQKNSTNKEADLKTLGKVGGLTNNQVTVDPTTGKKEVLTSGIFETSLASFKGNGKDLTEGKIVSVGPKGSIVAVITDDITKPKKTGQLQIVAIDRLLGRVQFAVKAASGGYVSGPGTPTSDSIPAMLSNGEYVISARAVQAAGVPMLDNINKMASGGMVSYNVPKMSSGGRVRFSEGGLASSSSSMYNINVQLNGTNLTADDVAASIHKEMRLREMAAGVNRRVGG
jgi:TP901 family phage tail tape measure protein